MNFYWGFYKNFKWPIFINIISTIVFSAVECSIAVLVQVFLQISGLIQSTDNTLFQEYFSNLSIFSFSMLLLAVSLARLAVDFFMHYTSAYVSFLGVFSLRNSLFKNFLNKVPLQPTTVNHLNGTVFARTGAFISILVRFISNVCLCTLLLVAMVVISWKQSLISIILTLIVGGVGYLISKKVKKYAQKLPAENNEITKYIQKVGSNSFYIQLTKMASFEIGKLQQKAKNILQHARKTNLLVAFNSGFTTFLGFIMIITIFYTSHFTFKDQMANSIPFLYLFMRYAQLLTGTVQNFGHLASLKPHHDEALRFYHLKVDPQKEHARTSKVVEKDIAIDFKNVSFSYEDKSIFQNLNFSIEHGQVVGITGESGIGKSTIFSLILGYIAPTKGEIQINNESPKNFFDTYNISTVYVGPEPFLFNGTLRQNITYGLSNKPTDKEIYTALESVSLEEFASKDKLEIEINEELSNLSSGQKQRICIARAFLSRPSLILLDEFSSNLDLATEKVILEKLKDFQKGTTTLIITHRKSALENVDFTISL